MEKQPISELVSVLKQVDLEKLNDEDKKELLKWFNITESIGVRNTIALIFADTGYNEAVPYILRKIKDKSLLNKNGTLVYALGYLDVKKYFIQIIRIICEQGYEARMTAYGLVEDLLPTISNSVGNKALKMLDMYEQKLEESGAENSKNSTLHYIKSTIALLES
jgi:hypothetical protein